MAIQYVGVRGMEKMKKCKVNPKHFVDDYGCLDCFTDKANQMMWKRIIEDEENERI